MLKGNGPALNPTRMSGGLGFLLLKSALTHACTYAHVRPAAGDLFYWGLGIIKADEINYK